MCYKSSSLCLVGFTALKRLFKNILIKMSVSWTKTHETNKFSAVKRSQNYKVNWYNNHHFTLTPEIFVLLLLLKQSKEQENSLAHCRFLAQNLIQREVSQKAFYRDNLRGLLFKYCLYALYSVFWIKCCRERKPQGSRCKQYSASSAVP